MNGTRDQIHRDALEEEDARDRTAAQTNTASDARQIAALESALADMGDRWMRSEAENANIRTRARRDVEEAKQFAVQKFAIDVVEAAENLRRGIDRLPQAPGDESDNIAGVRAGLIETERGFIALLERNGIRRDDPVGLPFDPNLHQAMSEQDSGEPAGTILQTRSPTWTLNGRLLRAAMVVISSNLDAPAASPP